MTQRITARKVECGDVRKIVARREIEMIKKRGWSGRDATNHGTKSGMWRCLENSRPLVLSVLLSVVYVKGIENVETHAIRTHFWMPEIPL